MATKSQAKPAPAPEAESEAKSESTNVRASDVQDTVFRAIETAGPGGISLKALEGATGLRYRVLHNVTWRLEVREERIHRVGEGRQVLYAANEVEAKPAPRKRSRRTSAAKTAA